MITVHSLGSEGSILAGYYKASWNITAELGYQESDLT